MTTTSSLFSAVHIRRTLAVVVMMLLYVSCCCCSFSAAMAVAVVDSDSGRAASHSCDGPNEVWNKCGRLCWPACAVPKPDCGKVSEKNASKA
jgi:hypothetical protein